MLQINSKLTKQKVFFRISLNTSRILCLFVPLLSTVFILSSAILIRAERLPIKNYTVADGLLRDNVYKIKQDSRGFLWFCTAEGVSRFDGYDFTNFTTAEGLPERHVNDFLETRTAEFISPPKAGLPD